MSGFFGAAGCDVDVVERLRRISEAQWSNASAVHSETGSLIGAAPPALLHSGNGARGTFVVAWDGEALIGNKKGADLLIHTPGGITVADGIVANVAVLHPGGCLELLAHCSGVLPLYYAEAGGGIVFASKLRPLAEVIGGDIDFCGLVQFLGEGYTVMGRTAFRGIRRLLPGQRLTRSAEGAISILETSRVWDRIDRTIRSVGDAADEFWSLLRREAGRDVALANRIPGLTLMISGGWDSRTLLAAYLAAGGASLVHAYSHGDPESRELRLVRRICRDLGVALQVESIEPDVLELDFLRASFEQAESVIFPHWHRAGLVAASSGPISTGIFGEIAGGGWNSGQLGTRFGKAAALALFFIGLRERDGDLSTQSLAGLRELLRWSGNEFYWYLSADAKRACSRFAQETNGDVDAEIDRFISRGATTVEQIVEAFSIEHRGAQYVANQLLSCGNSGGLLFPFARTNLMEWASRVPMRFKFQNRANRTLLKRHFPSLARYALASTLVPAGAPLLLQESSRALRVSCEAVLSTIRKRSGGRLGDARFDWVRFDWLRATPLLQELVNDLRSDIWDRRALNRLVASIRDGKWTGNLHHVFDQLGKIGTADRWLRLRGGL